MARAVPLAFVRKFRGSTLGVARLRLASGLVLFAFALTHLLNHALGLISLEAMQNGQDLRMAVTRSPPGTFLLIASALVHMILGLGKFLQVHTVRIGVQSVVQLAFGLLIPIFLIAHVLGTHGAHSLFGINDTYAFVLWAMWPGEAANLAILITLVWVHGCIGVHHWLSGRGWYRRFMWLWQGLAVLIPTLAFAGFVSAARMAKVQTKFQDPFKDGQYAELTALIGGTTLTYYAILGGAVVIWAMLLLANRLGSRITVTYANGPTVHAPRGLSLLAISRVNRVPHASVCGGRARCSTCRVRVLTGQEQLPPPSEREQQVLRRVRAPANVRLACQLFPTSALTVSTLLPARMDAARDLPTDKYLWGVEQDVTLMFCDLRGFTRMSEGRLSYDVVFLLNQFLGRMAETIEDAGGFVDKFMGDGIMAIFGMETTPENGARQAMVAARAMGGVLDALNQSLREALPAPLSMGIGLHTGPAILGRIGAVQRTDTGAARLTALGETVNLASRLESKTKDLGVQLVISAACAERAGLQPSDVCAPELIEVRGLSQPIAVYALRRAADLPLPGEKGGQGARPVVSMAAQAPGNA